jgi:hypothetical protein
MTSETAIAPDTVLIPLAPKNVRRVRLINALTSHGPAALLLLQTGLTRLRAEPLPHGAELALAVVATLAGGWQALVLLQEIRESRHLERAARQLHRPETGADAGAASDSPSHDETSHDASDPILHVPSLALALVYAAECWVHWHETGHVTRPYVFGAVAFAAFGFGGMQFIMKRRRAASSITLDAAGVTLRRLRRKPQHIAWPDVASIERTPTSLRMIALQGTSLHIDATRYDHAEDVLRALDRAVARFRDVSTPAPTAAVSAPPYPDTSPHPLASAPDPATVPRI